MVKVFIDFETRSRCDIKAAGAWAYAQHPSTEVLCLAVAEEHGGAWIVTEFDTLPPFHDAYIWAHNVQFERAIWENIMVPQYGWPAVPPDRWRCTMSLCARYGYPLSLDAAAKALGLGHKKDAEGHRTMLQMCKPNAKGQYVDTLEKRKILYEYCKRDVLVERAIHEALGELSGRELAVWLLDQKINARGYEVDLVSVGVAVSIIDQYEEDLSQRLLHRTGGAVSSAGQVGKIKEYTGLPDLRAETVEAALAALSNPAHEVLQIRQELSRSSTKKLRAMQLSAGEDGRVRGTLQYLSLIHISEPTRPY